MPVLVLPYHPYQSDKIWLPFPILIFGEQIRVPWTTNIQYRRAEWGYTTIRSIYQFSSRLHWYALHAPESAGGHGCSSGNRHRICTVEVSAAPYRHVVDTCAAFFPNRSCHRFNCFQMRRQRNKKDSQPKADCESFSLDWWVITLSPYTTCCSQCRENRCCYRCDNLYKPLKGLFLCHNSNILY